MSGARGFAEAGTLVAVTRIRNDDDIVEAFIRHHASIVDRHLLLDDGSNDATPAILAALKDEGVRLSVFRHECPWFDEVARNAFLLRQAASLGADWALFLDCDEFIDAHSLRAPLPALLREVPHDLEAVTAELVTYNPTAADDPGELIVPQRLRHRAPAPSGVRKVFVRSRVARAGARVMAGSHGLERDGAPVPIPAYPALFLGHYPMRTGWQMLAKATIGRLKVLATGPSEVARGSSGHYNELVDHLAHRPEWVTDPLFLDGCLAPGDVAGGMVETPLVYLGGPLRHTKPTDPRLAALRSVVAYAETLARSHGDLREVTRAIGMPGSGIQQIL